MHPSPLWLYFVLYKWLIVDRKFGFKIHDNNFQYELSVAHFCYYATTVKPLG